MKKIIFAFIILLLIYFGYCAYQKKQAAVKGDPSGPASGDAPVTPLSNTEAVMNVHENAMGNLGSSIIVIAPGRYDYTNPTDLNPYLQNPPVLGG